MEYLNIIVSVQIIFLFFILFFKNNNYLNKLLAIIILTPSVGFIFNTLDILNLLSSNLYGLLLFTLQPIAFLFAPLIFFYINLMCGKKLRLSHPLFIITAIIITYNYISLFDFLSMTNIDKQVYVSAIKNESPPFNVKVISIIFLLLQQIYFTFSAIKFYNFKKKVSNILSTKSNVKIDFTQKFVILIWILNIVGILFSLFMPIRNLEFIAYPFFLFLMNNLIFYYAFEYQAIFNKNSYSIFLKDLNLINSNHKNLKTDATKYKLNAKTIQKFLKAEKTYLNPDYTIFDLSKDLNSHHKEVSLIINNDINVNFSKLINDYRVEESKINLTENINSLTIEAIAEMSGFKSRASFYRSFKNKTGITPSEYIESLK
jgi:AraC-like DNA-binding protein